MSGPLPTQAERLAQVCSATGAVPVLSSPGPGPAPGVFPGPLEPALGGPAFREPDQASVWGTSLACVQLNFQFATKMGLLAQADASAHLLSPQAVATDFQSESAAALAAAATRHLQEAEQTRNSGAEHW